MISMFLLLCGCSSSPAKVLVSAPLEDLSTGAAVHSAVQQQRAAMASASIDAGQHEQAKLLLSDIGEAERTHHAEQARSNAAARAEREASEARAKKLEQELQSDTRWYWNLFALLGGVVAVAGAGAALFWPGVRGSAAGLAGVGILAVVLGLVVVAVLPVLKWLAIPIVILIGVFIAAVVLRLVAIARSVTATNEAAKRLLPEESRQALFSGPAPFADLIQTPATRAFVRRVRQTFSGERRSSSRTHTPAPAGSTPAAAIPIRSAP